MALSGLVARYLAVLVLLVCAHGVVSAFVYGAAVSGTVAKAGLLMAALAVLVLTFRQRVRLRPWMARSIERVGNWDGRRFLTVAMISGLGIRLLWWKLVPFGGPSWGDPLVNWMMADKLLHAGQFEAVTTYGSWRGLYPPGLPMLLVPYFLVLGQTAWAVLALNLTVYIGSSLCLYQAARALTHEAHARWVVLILAVHPGLFMYSSQPFKEPVLVFLLALQVLALVRVFHALRLRHAAGWSMVGGLAAGAAALTQPSLAPDMGIWLLALAALLPHGRILPCALAFLFGSALLVAPWTARQSLTFGKFVPLTTGPGWSFYTANNPASQGAFTDYKAFFPDLLDIPERDLSDVAFERGFAFVHENPEKFLELAARRQMMMTCCMDHAAIDTLRVAGYGNGIIQTGRTFAIAGWIALALTILLHGRELLRAVLAQRLLIVPMAMIVSTLAIHTVMEAGSRHMTMHLGTWVLLGAVALHRRSMTEEADASREPDPVRSMVAPRPSA